MFEYVFREGSNSGVVSLKVRYKLGIFVWWIRIGIN